MNIEDLKNKRKTVENDLRILNERATQNMQNIYRLQGAIFSLNDLIKEEEKEKKKEEDKKNKKVE